MNDKCEHITTCNKCGTEICSYCVEDCSGCQLEWCKDCYKEHQTVCCDCLIELCPQEIEVIQDIENIVRSICPKCNMYNATST